MTSMPSTPPITESDSSELAKKDASSRYHHGDLKSSLIEAANVILLRDGADALSLRAIAAEVGVSHMAPYSHFKNKKELIQAVSGAGFDYLAEVMDLKTQQYDGPGELILSYGAAYLDFAIGNPQLYRLMLGQVETQGRKNQKEVPVEVESSVQEPEGDMLSSSKRPFILLHDAFAKRGGDEAHIRAQALGAWSMVHGMAALIIEGHIHVPKGVSMKQFLAAATLHGDKF
jgi:AcrR family transcriptional regulator